MENKINKMEEKKKFSLPLYENGVKTEFTIDFEEGDDKWETIMNIHNEIPILINITTKNNGKMGTNSN